MSLLVSPRVLYLVVGKKQHASMSENSAHCSHTAVLKKLLQCWAVRAYMGPLWAHTHTLGDPKPSDQGHTVTPYKHRYTHPDKEKHTKHRNTDRQTHRYMLMHTNTHTHTG